MKVRLTSLRLLKDKQDTLRYSYAKFYKNRITWHFFGFFLSKVPTHLNEQAPLNILCELIKDRIRDETNKNASFKKKTDIQNERDITSKKLENEIEYLRY